MIDAVFSCVCTCAGVYCIHDWLDTWMWWNKNRYWIQVTVIGSLYHHHKYIHTHTFWIHRLEFDILAFSIHCTAVARSARLFCECVCVACCFCCCYSCCCCYFVTHISCRTNRKSTTCNNSRSAYVRTYSRILTIFIYTQTFWLSIWFGWCAVYYTFLLRLLKSCSHRWLYVWYSGVLARLLFQLHFVGWNISIKLPQGLCGKRNLLDFIWLNSNSNSLWNISNINGYSLFSET